MLVSISTVLTNSLTISVVIFAFDQILSNELKFYQNFEGYTIGVMRVNKQN